MQLASTSYCSAIVLVRHCQQLLYVHHALYMQQL